MSQTLVQASPPHHRPSRSATGTGRPYRAEIVAEASALFEETVLPCIEIAGRIGVCRDTVERWSRRFRWRRPGGDPALRLSAGGAAPVVGATTVCGRAQAGESAPDDEPAEGMRGRHPGRYDAERREAARALIEGTDLSWERIAVQIGIAPCTLWRWQRRYGWTRPPPPDTKPAVPTRYRMIRGKPYAADAVGRARHLVTTSRLSQQRIADQVSVSQGTVSNWIARHGWSRPPGAPACGAALAGRHGGRWRVGTLRHRRICPPDIVARARELFQQTELPAPLIAARLGICRQTIWIWAKRDGWTRPYRQPDSHGRLSGRRRQRARL